MNEHDNIVLKLGENHINPIQFIDVNNFDDVYGLYTYKGDVCVFKGGQDILFTDLGMSEQKRVYKIFLSDRWEINKHLQ